MAKILTPLSKVEQIAVAAMVRDVTAARERAERIVAEARQNVYEAVAAAFESKGLAVPEDFTVKRGEDGTVLGVEWDDAPAPAPIQLHPEPASAAVAV